MPTSILGDVIQGIGYFIIIAPFIILLVGMFLAAVGEDIEYIFSGFVGGTRFIILLVSCIFIGLVVIAVGKIIKSRTEYY